MDIHEKALKTYQELQKQKAQRAKFQEGEVRAFQRDSFYKCYKERRDLKIYR